MKNDKKLPVYFFTFVTQNVKVGHSVVVAKSAIDAYNELKEELNFKCPNGWSLTHFERVE